MAIYRFRLRSLCYGYGNGAKMLKGLISRPLGRIRSSIFRRPAKLECQFGHNTLMLASGIALTGRKIFNCRVNRAKTLLRYSPRTISEIADELRYCDIFAFSKQFKQTTGMTPKQYQRSE